jgi:hypothetical protein
MAARWGGLRLEPFDPDARDADGDGIVQEGTAWERPAGTQLLDNLGRSINRGLTSNQRPRGLQVVRNGKPVAYTPTYGDGPVAPTGAPSPLSEIGAPSLRERGLRNVRDITRPAPPAPVTPHTPRDPERRVVLYHGTSLETADRVLRQDGLLFPNGSQESDGSVNLTTTPEAAQKYGRVVFAIEVPSGEVEYDSDDARVARSVGIYNGDNMRIVGDLDKEKTYADEVNKAWREGRDYPQQPERRSLPTDDSVIGAAGRPLGYRPGDPDGREQKVRQRAIAEASGRAYRNIDELIDSLVDEELLEELLDEQQLDKSRLSEDIIGQKVADDLVSFVKTLFTSDAFIAAPDEAVLAMLKEGRYKSQFETGYAMGYYAPHVRSDAELRLLGISEELDDDLRPVYGFFDEGMGGDYVDFPTQYEVAGTYGDGFVIEVQRDAVKDRITMTLGDSLDEDLVSQSPSRFDELDRDEALAMTGVGVLGTMTRNSLVAYLETLDSPVADKILQQLDEPYDDGSGASSHYSEVQIHGGLSVNEIKVIWVTDLEDVDPEILDTASDLGIQLRDEMGNQTEVKA